MRKFYFENKDAETCYTEEHFHDIMKENGIESIGVLAANRVKNFVVDSIYCKHYNEVMPMGEYCGKDECEHYKPRNKISGCCIHVGQLYEHGEEVTLNLKKS